MSTAFALQGSLTYPPDDGQPKATRSFSTSGQFDHKAESTYLLTGAGTQSVDLGTMPAVKAALIEVDPTSDAPVNIRINGGLDSQEISPGGFWAYSNPAPSVGVTELDILHTMDARVQVYLLG
jgi:hypothetical protein